MSRRSWAGTTDDQLSEHSGAIANRRVFSIMEGQPGAGGQAGSPDGSTVDAEGCLWNAQWDGWRLVRYDPEEAGSSGFSNSPCKRPTSCIFGGPDLATLYVTSAIWDLEGALLAAQPLVGRGPGGCFLTWLGSISPGRARATALTVSQPAE